MNEEIKLLTTEQRNALLDAPDRRTRKGKRVYALLNLMALGGLRIGEACALRRNEVQVDGEITRLIFSGKGGKVRTVTLPTKAAAALHSYLAIHQSEWVFPKNTSHLAARGARFLTQEAAKKAGLPQWFHPHSLRHGFATALAKKQGIYVTQKVLGHSSPATTEKYYLKFLTEDADKAAEVFND